MGAVGLHGELGVQLPATVISRSHVYTIARSKRNVLRNGETETRAVETEKALARRLSPVSLCSGAGHAGHYQPKVVARLPRRLGEAGKTYNHGRAVLRKWCRKGQACPPTISMVK